MGFPLDTLAQKGTIGPQLLAWKEQQEAVMEEANTNPNLKMMRGSGGAMDYAVVARKGNMAFGVKPLAAMPGAARGLPGTTYFVVRVRVAPVGELFEEGEDSNVVKLGQKYKLPAQAWPNIEWMKSGSDRCSTILSMFVKGALGAGPELEKLLLDNVAGKAIGKKLADQIVELVGSENLVIKPRHLVDFTDEQFMGAINSAIEQIKQKKQAQEQMFAALEDNFGVEQKVLKDVYAKLGMSKSPHGDDEPELKWTPCVGPGAGLVKV
jgi:hypothetical protein